ncbi:hypothetical protein B0T19DRAFT_432263 [Cercophora scortea]|uniref:Uncharacterized protein n=1 Tax=Cercophora scortea TaxID=314031 RepID=A0AAE0IBS8_9PEZI|nr:hypothetical protein B0T19DRAFT_432263 [Cercophora scortea]
MFGIGRFMDTPLLMYFVCVLGYSFLCFLFVFFFLFFCFCWSKPGVALVWSYISSHVLVLFWQLYIVNLWLSF